jgi:hypothetical protein
MAQVIRDPRLAGETVATLKTNRENPKAALDSLLPTLRQARELTTILVSAWSQLLPDERLDAIADLFMHFPFAVGMACADRWSGIACTKIPDMRTGTPQPRRFPPSNGEIRDWCEAHIAELWKLARHDEIVDRPWESSPARSEPPKPTPTAEQVAHIWGRVNEIRDRCKRVLGEPTVEERRDVAERILQAMDRQRPSEGGGA